jgi:hypothetical protein
MPRIYKQEIPLRDYKFIADFAMHVQCIVHNLLQKNKPPQQLWGGSSLNLPAATCYSLAEKLKHSHKTL